MIVTKPQDFAWQRGPLPPAEGYDYDACVVLAWFVWPDRTWTFAQVYLRKSHTGASYWALPGGAAVAPGDVQWFAIIRDQPYRSFTAEDLDRIHEEVLRG